MKSRSPTSLQQFWAKNTEDEECASCNKRDSPLAYSSKYWKITLGKFLPTDVSSLFKPQQRLSPKKLGANMVKSLNTIQHFCKSFCGKADRRGITPPLHNGVYSCSKKNYLCLIMPAKLLDVALTCSSFCWYWGSKFHKTLTVKWVFLVNKIMCFPVFMTCLYFCCYFMQITHWT
jgi:hypothetical protein